MSSEIYSWLMPVWEKLQQQVKTDRLPHAMLWVSASGIGTETLGMHFLQWLMCTARVEDQPCGTCNHCQLFQAGSHPDFHHLTLQDKSKDIKIEQVRALIGKLMERPYQGGKRLVLVEPADRLNRAAANAFLKTLEEPGDDTFILLLTTRPEALAATIRSRCQTVHFQAPDSRVAFEYVQSRHPDDSTIIHHALDYAQNRPLTATHLIESGKLQEHSEFIAYLRAALGGKLDPVALAGQYKNSEQVAEICDWLYGLLSDAEKSAAGATLQRGHPDYISLVEKLSSQSPERRTYWLDKVHECKRTMIKGTNVNPVLTMESLMTGWIAFLAD